jgi:6-phosphogluconate dehydrogenase
MISLVGICVVFVFLIIMFLILSSFKHFIYDRNKKKTDKRINGQELQTEVQPKTNIYDFNLDGEIPQEEIAAVIAVLNNYNNHNLRGKKVIINKRG